MVVTRRGKPIARIITVRKGSPEDLLLEIGMILTESGVSKEEALQAMLELWRRFHSLCEVHKPSRKVVVCRDPKDDAYLSLCAEVMADLLVTGEKDLIVVDPAVTQGLPSCLKIITLRQFL